MADVTSNTPIASRSRPPRAEYSVYFVIIFLAALPLATLAFGLAALRGGNIDKGPVARAWSQARIITPMIFSA
ncbi:protein pufQ [Rhodobacterales bacterium HKCCE3408]|nr:protein pufQ [Rhodobacterales bacterium HKCCE3408]